jgi:organic hydroperoxide reductase OsmC/OhrA
MRISAMVDCSAARHTVSVETDGKVQALTVPARAAGRGSGVNGGEFLMLALATCYCSDLYREAQRLGIAIDSAHVQASAEFSGVGLAAGDIRYTATVRSPASADDIASLLCETDAVAEIHNTIRTGVPVTRV